MKNKQKNITKSISIFKMPTNFLFYLSELIENFLSQPNRQRDKFSFKSIIAKFEKNKWFVIAF